MENNVEWLYTSAPPKRRLRNVQILRHSNSILRFLSFREFRRFRLARSERNAGFWLASANPLRRQSSRTRTQPFTSSARLSHYSGVGAGAGVAKRGWKPKKLPTIPWRKERIEETISLSYFWKCFFKMLFPNSFVLASLSLRWRREGVCGGALVIKKERLEDEDEPTTTTAIPVTLNFLQVIEEHKGRERESVCVCACAPNGDDNWNSCSISLTHSFLPHTLWQYCSETRVSKTEVYLRRIKW